MDRVYIPPNRWVPAHLIPSLCVAVFAAACLHRPAIYLGAWLHRWQVDLAASLLLAPLCLLFFRLAILLSRTTHKRAAQIGLLIATLAVYWSHLAMSAHLFSKIQEMGIGILPPADFKVLLPTLKQGAVSWLFRPVLVYATLREYTGNGLWMALYLLFLLLVSVLPSLHAAKLIDRPYCVQRGWWMRPMYAPQRLVVFKEEEREALFSALLQGNVAPLLARPVAAQHDQGMYGLICFYRVRGEDTGYVALHNLSHKHLYQDIYDAQRYHVEEFLPPVLLSSQEVRALEQEVGGANFSAALQAWGNAVQHAASPPQTAKIG